MPEAINSYRKATINDIKNLMGCFLDEKLADLDK
jgi:hypothetical protein